MFLHTFTDSVSDHRPSSSSASLGEATRQKTQLGNELTTSSKAKASNFQFHRISELSVMSLCFGPLVHDSLSGTIHPTHRSQLVPSLALCHPESASESHKKSLTSNAIESRRVLRSARVSSRIQHVSLNRVATLRFTAQRIPLSPGTFAALRST